MAVTINFVFCLLLLQSTNRTQNTILTHHPTQSNRLGTQTLNQLSIVNRTKLCPSKEYFSDSIDPNDPCNLTKFTPHLNTTTLETIPLKRHIILFKTFDALLISYSFLIF